jgi:hypothetical protein
VYLVSIPISFYRPLNTLTLSSPGREPLEALQKSIRVTICENSENALSDAVARELIALYGIDAPIRGLFPAVPDEAEHRARRGTMARKADGQTPGAKVG